MPGHLTADGIQQAKELRDQLRDIHFDYIFTSDLKRAEDTTRIICEAQDCNCESEPLLRERDFGIHTGGPYIKISHALDPSAETIEQVAERAACFLRRVQQLPQGSLVLAVSHGLFLRVLQGVYYAKDTHEVEKMGNAEVRILDIQPSQHFGIVSDEVGGTAN